MNLKPIMHRISSRFLNISRNVQSRSASTASHDIFDVIIVGGGVVGATLACKLGKFVAFCFGLNS